MARSPLFLLGAVGLAIAVGAGIAAVILHGESTDAVSSISAVPTSQPSNGAPDPQLGRRIYARCQACHGIDGAGIPGNYPPLVKSPLLMSDDPTTAIRLLFVGVLRSEHWNGYMPSFAEQLDDAEIAAVLSYSRKQWGGQSKEVTAAEVAAVRLSRP